MRIPGEWITRVGSYAVSHGVARRAGVVDLGTDIQADEVALWSRDVMLIRARRMASGLDPMGLKVYGGRTSLNAHGDLGGEVIGDARDRVVLIRMGTPGWAV